MASSSFPGVLADSQLRTEEVEVVHKRISKWRRVPRMTGRWDQGVEKCFHACYGLSFLVIVRTPYNDDQSVRKLIR